MIWTHQGKSIPLEVYHGVPKGWYAGDLVAEHAKLGGTFKIGGAEATEPGAPSWMPERNSWLQYRMTLRRIAEGVRAHDPACIELAVRYIELRYIGSYSGFIRALLSRRLKHVDLSSHHKERLHRHFCHLVTSRDLTCEFKDYLRLWRLIMTPDQARQVISQVGGNEKIAGKLSVLLLFAPAPQPAASSRSGQQQSSLSRPRYVLPAQRQAKALADQCGQAYRQAISRHAKSRGELVFFEYLERSFASHLLAHAAHCGPDTRHCGSTEGKPGLDNTAIKSSEISALAHKLSEAENQMLQALARLQEARRFWSENKKLTGLLGTLQNLSLASGILAA